MRHLRSVLLCTATCGFAATAFAAPVQLLGDAQRATVPYNGSTISLAQLAADLLAFSAVQTAGLTTAQLALLNNALQVNGDGSGVKFTSGSSTRTGAGLIANQIADEGSIGTLTSGVQTNATAVTTEKNRATAAENALSSQIGTGTASAIPVTYTGGHTFSSADCGVPLFSTSANNVTWIVPIGLARSCSVKVTQEGAGRVIIGPDPTSAETLHSFQGANATAGLYASIRMTIDGATSFLLSGGN